MSAEVWEDEEYEYEEDEAWEEDEPDPEAVGGWLPARRSATREYASLALGLLAMAPLFLAYEYGLAADASLPRSQSERALFRLFSLAPDVETLLRRLTLGGALLGALVLCYRRRVALGPSLVRVFLEGLVAAVALGPALAYGLRLLGLSADTPALATDPTLPTAARVLGAAAFEELLFRVALYGALYVLSRRLVLFFGVRERVSAWVADLIAVAGSALGFAAIHLSSWTGWIGPEGEAFDPGVFTWRLLAGVLLALLFRWRGPGVAAWSHGLFNLALLVGADPEVFL